MSRRLPWNALFAVTVERTLAIGRPFVGDNPFTFQALVWLANVSMLGAIWSYARASAEVVHGVLRPGFLAHVLTAEFALAVTPTTG